MKSDFYPIPETGVKYKTPQGEIYEVKKFLCNLGDIPDTVVYVNVKSPEIEFEDGYEEWNAKEFKRIGSSEPIDEPGGTGNVGGGKPDEPLKGGSNSDPSFGDSGTTLFPSLSIYVAFLNAL